MGSLDAPSSSAANAMNFTLISSVSSAFAAKFGPRVGHVVFKRTAGAEEISISTPGLLTSTSRGVVPHLSRDHVRSTEAVKWVHVPFETFLEHNPPVPTLQQGKSPLHTFLGYTPSQHVVSMAARNSEDESEMPANGNGHLSVRSLRGVRKLTPEAYRSYVYACQPDLVIALSDTPFTTPPYSQKRLTKSIERSTAWLIDLLKPSSAPAPGLGSSETPVAQEGQIPSPTECTPTVLLHMAGIASLAARKAFSDTLLESLYGPEAVAVAPLQRLDDGVAGYTFDLAPLRTSLAAIPPTSISASSPSLSISDLLRTSLDPLPTTKPRLAFSPRTPHEILTLIDAVGIDIFDAAWAQAAAGVGVALDFSFPATPGTGTKRDLGHNLYDIKYAHNFSPLADEFIGAFGLDINVSMGMKPVCPCAACSPIAPSSRLYHGVDTPDFSGESLSQFAKVSDPTSTHIKQYKPSLTCAYLHHLLHTHEMSAHALLVMHNLAVVDAFFAGVRGVLQCGGPEEKWKEVLERFFSTYDEGFAVLDEAKRSWKEVDMARGKGRLAREREREVEAEAVAPGDDAAAGGVAMDVAPAPPGGAQAQ